MIKKVQYQTLEERDNLINQHRDYILIEEQNLITGNFLIFSNVPRIEDQVTNISNTVDLLLLKQEGIL